MKLKYKQKKKTSNVQFQETTADHQSDHKMAPKERVSFDCECVSVRVFMCMRVCVISHGTTLCVFMSLLSILSLRVCTCARAPPNTYRDACRDTEGHVNTNTHI